MTSGVPAKSLIDDAPRGTAYSKYVPGSAAGGNIFFTSIVCSPDTSVAPSLSIGRPAKSVRRSTASSGTLTVTVSGCAGAYHVLAGTRTEAITMAEMSDETM